MTDLEVKTLQLENNGMKLEILALREQLAQAVRPHVQQERDKLIAEFKEMEAALKKAPALAVVPKE